jgi:hypothetical protein
MSCDTSKEHVNSCLKLGGLTPISLVRHSDSDYTNSLVDTVSRLARELLSYLLGLRKQKFVADLSCYAEYRPPPGFTQSCLPPGTHILPATPYQ